MMLAEWGVPGDAAKARSLLVNAESVATAHGYGPCNGAPGTPCDGWTPDNRYAPGIASDFG